MPRRRRAGKAKGLTPEQADELGWFGVPNGPEWTCGIHCRPPLHEAGRRCGGFRSYFPSDEARERAWWTHRSDYLEPDGSSGGNPTARPFGFWWYECDGERPDCSAALIERALWLAERGHLADSEAAYFIADARLHQEDAEYQRVVEILRDQLAQSKPRAAPACDNPRRTMTIDHDAMNSALRRAAGVRVSYASELDEGTKEMDAALRRAAGRAPVDHDDAEPDDDLPPAGRSARGSLDGGARLEPSPEPDMDEAMNALLRRRPVRDAHGHLVGHADRAAGTFTPTN